MAGRFFDDCGGATAGTSSHHVQTRLKIILPQIILPFFPPHVLSHFIVCSHAAAAAEQRNEVDFSFSVDPVQVLLTNRSSEPQRESFEEWAHN